MTGSYLLTKESIPTLLTPALIQVIAAAVRQGMYIERACNLAGISKMTYYSWLDAAQQGNPICNDLVDACKRAEAEHQADMLATINRCAREEHGWLPAMTHLERRYRSEYGQQREVAPVQVQVINTIEVVRAVPAIEGEVVRPELGEAPPGLKDDKGT